MREQYLDAFQSEVSAWGRVTFPEATRDGIIAHLEEEVKELACVGGEAFDGALAESELADCFLLLLQLAERCGVSLAEAAQAKMQINRGRTWAPAPGGYWKHVEEGRDEG